MLDTSLTEYSSCGVCPLYTILFQTLVLTGSETLFPPLTPLVWGSDGFSHYYLGGGKGAEPPSLVLLTLHTLSK